MYDFGYDIADFYAIHDEFGDMEDFEELLKRADELGKYKCNRNNGKITGFCFCC